MAPSHLSVREMREDEKPLVLEMLKAGVKDTENRVALHALTRPPALLLLAAASSGLRFVLASFALALLLPVFLAVTAVKLGLRARWGSLPPPGGLGALGGRAGLPVTCVGSWPWPLARTQGTGPGSPACLSRWHRRAWAGGCWPAEARARAWAGAWGAPGPARGPRGCGCLGSGGDAGGLRLPGRGGLGLPGLHAGEGIQQRPVRLQADSQGREGGRGAST
uniref:N-acetyltransferase 14 n=1 Tax=Macaca fascicularis TaxID=9541 RepID=A0A7N9ICE2_MACFA